MARRFELLKPGITVYGDAGDTVRPAILFFHGCGGMRPHVHLYAQAAARTGARAYVIDSFGPRGWNRAFAASMICTGAVMQGYERSGDVVAALWGVQQEGRTDMDRTMLAGFSHGGWAIMDLMTEPLTRPGEAKLADADAALVDRVKGLFLVYPYINFPAQTNSRPWVRKPATFAVLAEKDHLTPIRHSQKVFARLKDRGVPAEAVTYKASHAFDEETNKGGIMTFDPACMNNAMTAMARQMRTSLAV